mgnify:CR=1 FL=1
MGTIQLRSKKQGIGFMKDEEGIVPKRFVTRAVKYSTIDINEIAQHCADDSGVSRATVKAAVKAILLQFEEMLLNGHIVKVGNLGSFRLATISKGVKDPTQVSVENIVRKHIIFTPSPELKHQILAVNLRMTVIV